MRRILLCLAAFACAAAQNKSTITGTVLDPSGSPVESALVDCGGKSAHTNDAGLFSIAGVDECTATITKAGFKPAIAKLSAGAHVEIRLVLAGPVETVIVTATRAETTPERAGVAASVITGRDLAARNYPFIADALREVPGMQISDTGRLGDLTVPYTRGAGSTGTLVLLDGMPLNDPGGQINLAHLGSEDIERVEVVRGPESALFGAEAAAGVIQLFTKRGDPESAVPHVTALYERGSFDTDRWYGGIAGGYGGRFDYSLNAAQLHTAGEYAKDFYRDTTGSANLGYRFSAATQARAVFRIYDAHVGTPGQVGYGITDYDANEETRDSTVSLKLDDTRSPHFFQRFTFGYNRLRDRFNDNFLDGPYDVAALLRDVPGPHPRSYFVSLLAPPFPAQAPAGLRLLETTQTLYPFPSLNLTDRIDAGYQGTWAQSNGALVFGYEYEHQAGTISNLDVDREHNGIFINEQKTFGRRFSISAGARVEHSSAFGAEFVPRASASFLVAHATWLRASAGRGITEPSLFDNFAQSTFFHGNPALKPEVTRSYEVGIVQELFHRRLHAEVSAFRSSFTNLIAFVDTTWTNIEASWARGLEMSAALALPSAVRVEVNYTRLYTRITNSVSPASPVTGVGDELVRRPRNSGAVIVSWNPRRWSLVTGARFVGERQDADFTFGANRNPGYENVYVSGSFQLTKHAAPIVRMDNLLNERYSEVLGYPTLTRSAMGGLRLTW